MTLLTERETFIRDLNHGRQFERLAQHHLIDYMKKKHNRTFILEDENDNREYDFRIVEPSTRRRITVEVKADRKSRTTGNFFIEYKTGTNKPSGINTTKACNYIITDEIDYYLIRTEKIKKMLNNNGFITAGTTGSFINKTTSGTYTRLSSHGYIVPKAIIIERAIKIN